ncbi:Otu1 protein [Candida orthopsilosis Co 90-125]|uniref:Ubiquitin thioesterase OTU n=1 Tax=Candida orthopsilosis (strain 90-125) TaxID=1136231 RepID=H8X1R7_CANO9|nr:Otu1 protein [Candida orthopsilosis Co 90-125]CCG22472.1 Otu1 protein [Candida orthopsilosis Co 90-125]
MEMRLKLKSDSGVSTIKVDSEILFQDFLADIKANTDLHIDTSESISMIKTGFPPKSIDLVFGPKTTLQDKHIKDGDQLSITFISTKRPLSPQSDSNTNVAPLNGSEVRAEAATNKKRDLKEDIPAVYIESENKYLILRNIPDDNSCLFNSISYAISGHDSYTTFSPPQELRNVVVDYVNRDPVLYSDTVLGRPREEYCRWILKKDSWGGAIELGILADWFDVRVICIDIESGNFIRIENEEKKPTKFMLLIYSGIHYDVLALGNEVSTKNKDQDECLFRIGDSREKGIIEAAEKLCKLLQEKDYSTNTTTFRVRCLDCYSILVGELGASKHAEQTGHLNFGEVKKT